jgi:hypothetical protein
MNAPSKVKQSGVVNIHGREYQTVAFRVQQFREHNPDWALITDIVCRDEECVVVKATILGPTGQIMATGHAEEYRKSSQINRTSALENAETSAIGRALAALGFGGTEFATANEVQNAIHQQTQPDNDPDGHRDPTIPGITKIRNNINKLRRDGAKATDLEAFNALVHGCKDDLQKIKDADHSLWTGMGEDFDGMKAWIKRRREELAGSLEYQLLVSTLDECTGEQELQSWLTKNGDVVGQLDGEESRKFEALYDAKAEALKAPAEAGVIGG